jgi:tetratricopeptide (TPR) repeat protein
MFAFYKSHQKLLLLLIVSCLVIYLRSIGNGYNLDDELVTIQHPLTAPENGLDLQAIFTSPYSIEKFGYTYGYRPMVHLSFAIEHQLFGESPAMSHFVNLLLYVLTVLFLAYFLTQWLGAQHFFVIGLSSLFFAIHPLHVEVVASIKNRDELLAFLAALLALHAYLRLMVVFKIKYFILMFIFSVIALLSKKTAIPLIVLIPLLDIIYHQRCGKTTILLWTPLLLLSLWVGLDFSAAFFTYAVVVVIILSLAFLIWNQYPKWVQKGVFAAPIFMWLACAVICALAIFLAIQVHISLSLILVFPVVYAFQKAQYPLLIMVSAVLFYLGIYFKQAFFVEVIYLSAILILPKIWRLPQTLKWLFMIIACLALPTTLWIVHNPNYLFALLLFSLIIFIYNRSRTGLALLISITQTVFTLSTGDFSFATVYLSTALLLFWLKNFPKMEYIQRSIFTLMGILVICFGFLDLPQPKFDELTKIDKQLLISQSNQISEKNGVKEGRPLEFVENPLVYPHSKQEKLATSLQVVTTYLTLHVMPYPLRYYYGYKTTTVHSLAEGWSVFSLVLVILLFFAAFRFYKINRLFTVGTLLLIIPLIMASNWFVLIAGMVAERHTYAATIGFSLLLGLLFTFFKISSWEQLKQKRPLGILFLVLVFGFTIQSFTRVAAWKSPIVLMETDASACRASAHANSLLATSYIKSATEDLTLSQFEKEARIDQAIFRMKKAIQIFPYLFNYEFDLGRFYVLKGDMKQACIEFEKANELVPSNPLALDELVKCNFDLNRTNETLRYGKKLLKVIGPQEKTLELMAYQALTSQNFEAAQKWATEGMRAFAANPNFPRLIADAQAKRIINKNQ